MWNETDKWFVAEGERGDLPLLVRGRQHLRSIISPKSHTKLLRILWTFKPTGRSGLPCGDVSAKMTAFESSLFDEFEMDALCVFFCVYLHNGVKEWLAYTSDVQATCDRINMALSDQDPYPIQITVEGDPNWQEYQQLLEETGMQRPTDPG